MLADTGYQGIQKLYANVDIPNKKKRGVELTKKEVENVFALLKRFKIITDKYRNRRSRFGLRFNLISGVHNYELDF